MFHGLLLLALLESPVDRAVNYLSKEVAKWRTENGCFSCHNNGDGARALYAAGLKRDGPFLAATTEWLASPKKWETNPGDPVVSDKRLARIQFATALRASGASGSGCEAAPLVAADQSADGSWPIDDGSPATYGTVLATHFAYVLLRDCRHPGTVRAEAFLRSAKPSNVADAAALLLTFSGNAATREYLLQSQNPNGGWGQFARSPSQVFDTAIAMLALKQGPEVDRGRSWLESQQFAEGGWPGTTRPPGSQSYAQHISTTAWATLALLATDPERQKH